MNKPLVTITTLSYNQEKYIREAIRGLLSQTYEPLEIIISDDHSTDQTWQIIREEVGNYERSGGVHKNIVLNRNEKNLGIAKHYDFVNTMIHGALMVEGAGDDVSLPDRVSRIVEEWEKSGRQATLVHHGYVEMDVAGRDIRIMPPRNAECALGATVAYAIQVLRGFSPLEGAAVEDQVWAKRALMLGPELRIPDVLVRYRVGAGVSTSFVNQRERIYKNAFTMAASCEQVLKDLEEKKRFIEPTRYELVKDMAQHIFDESTAKWKLVGGKTLADRWWAYKVQKRRGRFATRLSCYFDGVVYLFPKPLCDAQRWGCYKVLAAVGKIRSWLTHG